MKRVKLSVTQARDQFFDLVNAAYYGGQIAEIKKGVKVVARIVPVDQPQEVDWQTFFSKMKKLSQLLTEEDYEDMAKTRKSFNKRRFPDW